MITKDINVLTVKRIMDKFKNAQEPEIILNYTSGGLICIYPRKENEICYSQAVEWETNEWEVTRSCLKPDFYIFPFFNTTGSKTGSETGLSKSLLDEYTNCHDWDMMGNIRRCLHFCDTGRPEVNRK